MRRSLDRRWDREPVAAPILMPAARSPAAAVQALDRVGESSGDAVAVGGEAGWHPWRFAFRFGRGLPGWPVPRCLAWPCRAWEPVPAAALLRCCRHAWLRVTCCVLAGFGGPGGQGLRLLRRVSGLASRVPAPVHPTAMASRQQSRPPPPMIAPGSTAPRVARRAGLPPAARRPAAGWLAGRAVSILAAALSACCASAVPYPEPFLWPVVCRSGRLRSGPG